MEEMALCEDLSNAFNTRRRKDVLQAPSFRPMWRLAAWSYSRPSPLLLRGSDGQVAGVLQSCEGVRQGDPLAPLLFALSMKSIYNTVSEHGGGRALLVAVHDDLTILGPPAEVARCHDLYKRLTQEAA